MKFNVLFLFLFAQIINTYSQDTIRYLNDNFNDTIKYSATNIVHINYTDSIPYTKWYYKNSLSWKQGPFDFVTKTKNGVWQHFSDMNTITREGKYVRDSMEGLWTYYHATGEICGEVEYKNNKVIDAKYFDTKGRKVKKKKANIFPEFPGGQNKLLKYIAENIYYPPEAKAKNWQGKAVVEFVINKNGEVSNVRIKKSTQYQILDIEAARIILSLPRWNPGKQHNQPVFVRYSVPINFRLVETGN